MLSYFEMLSLKPSLRGWGAGFKMLTPKTPNPRVRWSCGGLHFSRLYVFLLIFWAVHDISRTFEMLTP